MAEAYRFLLDACQVLSLSPLSGILSFLSGITIFQTFVFYLDLTSHLHLFEFMLPWELSWFLFRFCMPWALHPPDQSLSTLSSHSHHPGLPWIQEGRWDQWFPPSNPTPLLTLESGSSTTCLQITSLCHPCRVYMFFIFSALCGFLYLICYFCPFVFLLMFLIGPRMYSSIPLYSWANPAPPSGPSEMRWLWWSSVGFTPSWTDRPSASFQLSGAVNFCYGSLLPWLLL